MVSFQNSYFIREISSLIFNAQAKNFKLSGSHGNGNGVLWRVLKFVVKFEALSAKRAPILNSAGGGVMFMEEHASLNMYLSELANSFSAANED